MQRTNEHVLGSFPRDAADVVVPGGIFRGRVLRDKNALHRHIHAQEPRESGRVHSERVAEAAQGDGGLYRYGIPVAQAGFAGDPRFRGGRHGELGIEHVQVTRTLRCLTFRFHVAHDFGRRLRSLILYEPVAKTTCNNISYRSND